MAVLHKKVTFKLLDTNQQTNEAESDIIRQIPVSESTGRKCGTEEEPKSMLVPGSDVSPSPGRYKKGLNAQFLRYNPRYIHEPVCRLLPNEMSSSVGECLVWSRKKDKKKQRIVSHSLDSTSRSHYQSFPGEERPPPLSKHVTRPQVHGIVPLTIESTDCPGTSMVTEYISYQHDYNCRTEPNEPVRGKLHGSFVLKPIV